VQLNIDESTDQYWTALKMYQLWQQHINWTVKERKFVTYYMHRMHERDAIIITEPSYLHGFRCSVDKRQPPYSGVSSVSSDAAKCLCSKRHKFTPGNARYNPRATQAPVRRRRYRWSGSKERRRYTSGVADGPWSVSNRNHTLKPGRCSNALARLLLLQLACCIKRGVHDELGFT